MKTQQGLGESRSLACDFEVQAIAEQRVRKALTANYNIKGRFYETCVQIFFFFNLFIHSSSGRQASSSTTVRTCSAMLGLSPEVKATHFDGLVLNCAQVSDHVTLSCFCLDIFSETPSCQTSGVIGGRRTLLFTFLHPPTRRRFAEQALILFFFYKPTFLTV